MLRRLLWGGRRLPQRPVDMGKGAVLPAAVEARLRRLLTRELAGDETPQLILTAVGPEEGGAVERMSVMGFAEVELAWMRRIIETMEGWVVDVVLTPRALELWFVQPTPRANGLTTHQGTALVDDFETQSRGADAARVAELTRMLQNGLRALAAMYLDQTRPPADSRAELRPNGELHVSAIASVCYQPLARVGFAGGLFGVARDGVLWARLGVRGDAAGRADAGRNAASPRDAGGVVGPSRGGACGATEQQTRKRDGATEQQTRKHNSAEESESESEEGSDEEEEEAPPVVAPKRARAAATT